MREDVPIVGQPCTPLAWFPTVSLICNCADKQPVLLVGLGSISVCPKCGRGFQLHGVRQDIRNGQPPHFDINIILPTASGTNGDGAPS
jgi:hypothetical protein